MTKRSCADGDLDPPRHWRETNPGCPGDRLVFAALRAWRPVILARRFEIHVHARARMAERDITLDQILAAVQHGWVIPAARAREGDEIRGGYLAGSLMVIVCAVAPRGVGFRDLVPTVLTLYRTEQFDPAQPLMVPISAFVAVSPGSIALERRLRLASDA